jgi:hypothetical protein
MKGHCPKCGQPIPEKDLRGGVFLSPQRRRIFDTIRKNPGMTAMELAELLYPDKPPAVAAKTVAQTVHHINDQLASTETDLRIKRRGYRIEGDQK